MNYTLRILKLLAGQSTETQRNLLRLAQLVDVTPQNKTKTESQGKTYTVKSGDTLSGIAEEQFGSPEVWPQIYSENKEAIGNNPNLIQPGLQLKLPTSIRQLTSQERSMMQQQSQKMHQGLPQGKDARTIAEEAKKRGLVSLEGIPIKESTRQAQSIYVDPRIKGLMQELASGVSDANGKIQYQIGYVTEAWPPTVRHISQSHYTGGALDFTVHPKTQLSEIRRLVQYMKNRGFRVANEYEQSYSTTTGKHLHVAVSTPQTNLVASKKAKPTRGS